MASVRTGAVVRDGVKPRVRERVVEQGHGVREESRNLEAGRGSGIRRAGTGQEVGTSNK